MKINLIKISFIVSLFFALTGCVATHVGTMVGSASLDSPNFEYKKKDVTGEAVATYFLGIGGVSKQSLVFEAKQNMLRANPLLKNQALANVSVSYKWTGFLGFVFVTVKCNVSADIVEFESFQTENAEVKTQSISSSTNNPNTSTVENKMEVEKAKVGSILGFKVGDSVKIINYFSKPVNGKVIEIHDGQYIVEYKKSNDKTKQVKVLSFQLEKIN